MSSNKIDLDLIERDADECGAVDQADAIALLAYARDKDAELAALRAENERLTKSNEGHVSAFEMAERDRDKVRAYAAKLKNERDGDVHLWEDDYDNDLGTLSAECVILIWPYQLKAFTTELAEAREVLEKIQADTSDPRMRTIATKVLNCAALLPEPTDTEGEQA